MIRKRGTKNGFTLLELSIAAGVMVVAFVLIMQEVVSISTTREIVTEQAQAVAALSSTLEQLRILSFQQLLQFQPVPTGRLGAGETVQVFCFDQNGVPVALPVTVLPLPVFPNPVETQVIISWRDPSGRVFTRSASTMIGR